MKHTFAILLFFCGFSSLIAQMNADSLVVAYEKAKGKEEKREVLTSFIWPFLKYIRERIGKGHLMNSLTI